ncbi:HAMP domain-containing protein [Clostridium bovifaecis]|uniref:histidine kinase n=1 Tax=Clostridium bovifaecis TaxID=2184719 RepID=A0A6I6F129_9CLOT|nr:HAMP domain-containing protein [Clostridium bovifaecis]
MIYVSIFNNDRNVLYTTDNTDKFLSFYDNVNSLSIIDSPHGIVIILNDKLDSNKETYYIQTYKSLAAENLYISTLAAILLGVNLSSLLIIILISSKASRKMLSPIEEMTKTVKTISVEALDTRLNISGSKDELKELAETFNEMIDRIQQSYEQQNQFVSDASHELRTPIAVIQGYASLLSRWGKNDKSVLDEGISAIKSESEGMKNLVENLLFLARGDKNTQRFEKESFLINELIDDLIKETKLIDNKKHNIICSSNDVTHIYADRRLLKEALRIFIDNSVKFTPENGTIKISAYNRINNLELVVEDTGIGISKEDLPFIFNRFYQVDKARTKDKSGNGLGLSIAKWIISKHSGKIFVESQVNKGTKVSINLPIQK